MLLPQSSPRRMTAISFQTPDSEIRARLNTWRKPYKNEFCLPEPFVRQHFAAHAFPHSLLHHPDRDFGNWKATASRALANGFFLPNALGTPSEATLRYRDDSHSDYVVEELEITVTPPLRTPATVVIPRNGADRHPAVVALHCMGGYRLYGREKLLARTNESPSLTEYRQRFYDGQSLQAELARAGYLSIAIDAINFGERIKPVPPESLLDFEEWRQGLSAKDITNLYHAQCSVADNLLARALLALGYSTPALVACDDRRTVDYLLSRPDVDPARIACAGLSFGAFRAKYLAALDSRVKTAVSVCWLSTLAGVIESNLSGALGFFALPPGFYRDFDLADIAAMAAPKPFLAISGWQDPMIQPAGIAQAHLFFRRTWEQAGAPENLGTLLFETGHVFNAQMQKEAIAFLQQHL